MIYYTAVSASGGSYSGAATAGQPAHTNQPHTRHPSPRSPGFGVSRLPRHASACRQPAGRGQRAWRLGGPEPGVRGAGRTGISPEKLQAALPAEHPFSPTLLAKPRGLAVRTPRLSGLQQQQRDPPGLGGPEHLHLHSLCNVLQVSPSEPGWTEAHDPGCRADRGTRAEAPACAQRGHPGRERRRRDAATQAVLLLPPGIAAWVAVWSQAPRKCPPPFLSSLHLPGLESRGVSDKGEPPGRGWGCRAWLQKAEWGGWVCGGGDILQANQKVLCRTWAAQHTHPPQAGPAHTSAGDPGSSGQDWPGACTGGSHRGQEQGEGGLYRLPL